ncbi:SPOR domain-containing protein [Neptunicella marina]|uniref:SPOR domain-containing protein n=1 Tax=Neptunicella marina TaxID=2125989 RepID=A0A8J6M5V1_9ALTE|nr:SPOR domain-containing protein [Neptunicella marina]
MKISASLKVVAITVLLCQLYSFNARATELRKVTLNEDDYLILSVRLNDNNTGISVDAYPANSKLLFAVSPLFDGLGIRYKLNRSQIEIWRDETAFNYSFNFSDINSTLYWSENYGEYFIDSQIVEEIFNAKVIFDPYTQRLDIKTADAVFPIQILDEQERTRRAERLSQNKSSGRNTVPTITIPDQYRLYTFPTGYLNAAADFDKEDNQYNLTLQLTSDFLYHSTELTMSDTGNGETQARLAFSRYKQTPDEPVLGFFDHYTFGDVTSSTSSLTSNSQSGVGVNFVSRPEFLRTQNQSVTFKETAPPGWEAEVFLNGRFLQSTVVPDDGYLILNDLETQYGANNFEIKLYGPYGEERVITKYLDLTKNALAEGETSSQFYALSGGHRLINDRSNDNYNITDFGGNFDYGLSDSWQIGLRYSSSEIGGETKQSISLKNAFAFPGLLLENDISVDSNGGYAQLSTLNANGFGRDVMAFSYLTAKDFKSNRINAERGSIQNIMASYTGRLPWFDYNFAFESQDNANYKSRSYSNRISSYFSSVSINNELRYNQNWDHLNEDDLSEFWTGRLTVGGRLSDNIRVNGNLVYDPEKMSLKESSTVGLTWKLTDPWDLTHYITGRYYFIGEQKQWSISENLAKETPSALYTLSASYNSESSWSIQAGVRFFFNYDYYNNRAIFNSRLGSANAVLSAHTYLDRQLNGIPDPLDYDLEGVSFTGNPSWQNITSGKTGRAILPGISTRGVFQFGANWQNGTQIYNNDYVVYAHPGAYVEANMPFYMSSDFIGYVYRDSSDSQVGITNVPIFLKNADDEVVKEIKTDLDGYFELNELKPGQYIIEMSPEYVSQQGYTSDTIGYRISTPRSGGLIELRPLVLERVEENGQLKEQAIRDYKYTENDVESLIWSEDELQRRNLFLLPTKSFPDAPHSLGNEMMDSAKTTQEQRNSLQLKSDVKVTFPHLNKNANGLAVAEVQRGTATQRPTQNQTVIVSAVNQNNALQTPTVGTNDLVQMKQGNKYSIQVGAYSTKVMAEQMLASYLQNKGSEGDVEAVMGNSGTLYKVYIGKFNTPEEARLFADANWPQQDTFVIKRESKNAVQLSSDDVNTIPSKGWVLQFMATATMESLRSSLTDVTVNEFYIAEKNVAGTHYYCVISKDFLSKALAMEYKNKNGLNAWPIETKQFQDIRKLSNGE